MNDKPAEQDELTLNAFLVPSLDAAAQTWLEARQIFQNEAGKEQRDAHMKATDELGQAFSAWSTQIPGFGEQLALWCDSHSELLPDGCGQGSLVRGA